MNGLTVAKWVKGLLSFTFALSVTLPTLANIGIVAGGIAGGTAVVQGHPLHKSVVRIEFYARMREADGSLRRVRFSQCTGALVRENKILTAEHCNEDLPPLSGLQGPTEANAVFLHPILTSEPLAAISMTNPQTPPAHATGFGHVSKHDLRLYTLSQPAPAHAVALPIGGVDMRIDVATLQNEKEFVVAGFGMTQSGAPSPFLKRGKAFVPDWDQQIAQANEDLVKISLSLKDNKNYFEDPVIDLTSASRREMEILGASIPKIRNEFLFYKANPGSAMDQEPIPGLSLPGDSGGAILLPLNDAETEFVIVAVTSAIGGTSNGRGGPILPIPQQLYGAPVLHSNNSCFLQNQLGIPRNTQFCTGPIR